MGSRLAAFALVAGVGACSPSAAEVACEDLGEVIAQRVVDCSMGAVTLGEARAELRRELERRRIPCDEAEEVDDIEVFYDECLPYLRSVECSQLTGPAPLVCRDQIQV